MKKYFKNITCLCLCMVLLTLLAGCTTDKGKEKKDVIEEEYINYWTTFSQKAKMIIAGNYIQYIDPVSAKERLICNDVNCSHKDSKTCGAVVDGTIFGAIHREGKKIYYVGDADTEKLGKCSLFEADLDGKNRKKIASLMEANIILSAIYTEKQIYITYAKDSEEDEKSQSGIYVYDREKKTGKVIYQINKVSAMVHQMVLSDGILYANTGYCDVSAAEIKKHKEDINYVNEHFKRNLIAIRLKDSKVVQTIHDIESDLFLIRDHKLFYTTKKAAFYYDIHSKKSCKIADDSRILIFSDKKTSNTLYFRDENHYYRYDIKKKSWNPIAKAEEFFAEAIVGDTVYGFMSGSKEGQQSGDGIMKRSDFEKGNWKKIKTVENEWETD